MTCRESARKPRPRAGRVRLTAFGSGPRWVPGGTVLNGSKRLDHGRPRGGQGVDEAEVLGAFEEAQLGGGGVGRVPAREVGQAPVCRPCHGRGRPEWQGEAGRTGRLPCSGPAPRRASLPAGRPPRRRRGPAETLPPGPPLAPARRLRRSRVEGRWPHTTARADRRRNGRPAAAARHRSPCPRSA